MYMMKEILILSLLFVTTAFSKLLGPNVCAKPEPYVSLVRVSKLIPHEEKTNDLCLSFPPVCSNSIITYTTGYEDVNVTGTRLIDICCEGYIETSDSSGCIPYCSQRCIHGQCADPGRCDCESGFGGLDCNKTCPQGYFGEQCKTECSCKLNFVCNAYGGCTCKRGYTYTGETCDTELISKSMDTPEYYQHSGSGMYIFAVLLLICAIVTLFLYYRKRGGNLNEDMTPIYYVSDPGVNDQLHFVVNPVSLDDPPLGGDDVSLNNGQMKNSTGYGSFKENNLYPKIMDDDADGLREDRAAPLVHQMSSRQV